jgi:hypothetical protein
VKRCLIFLTLLLATVGPFVYHVLKFGQPTTTPGIGNAIESLGLVQGNFPQTPNLGRLHTSVPC